MKIIVFATDNEWAIGNSLNANGLPWESIPEDFEHFKNTTIEIGRVVAGSKTFLAMMEFRKNKLLPKREMAVLSEKMTERPHPEVPVFKSIEEIDEYYAGKDYAIIGGAETIRRSLPTADKIIMSLVDGVYTADAYLDSSILENFNLDKEKVIRWGDEKGPKVTVKYYSREK